MEKHQNKLNEINHQIKSLKEQLLSKRQHLSSQCDDEASFVEEQIQLKLHELKKYIVKVDEEFKKNDRFDYALKQLMNEI